MAPSDQLSSTFSRYSTVNPMSTPTTPCRILSENDSIDYELKNARDALVGSISALIDFCRHSGVSKPSIDQLEQNLKMKKYYAVMTRLQNYVGCIESESEDAILAKVHLAVTAWEFLCRYINLQYKRAYKNVYRLRDSISDVTGSNDNSSVVSSSVTSLSSSITLSILPASNAMEIARAIEDQIKLAEQCTECRKKLYLVRRWEKQILQSHPKSSSIKQKGYQSIPC